LLFSKSHQVTDLDKLGHVPQQVGVDRLRGAGHVDVMKQTVNDGLKKSKSNFNWLILNDYSQK
jgi:hypothetical protein